MEESNAMIYLEEVFGITSIDGLIQAPLTLDCIRENARDGYRLDQELCKLVDERTASV